MLPSSAPKRAHPNDDAFSTTAELSDYDDFARCLSSAGSEEDFEVIAQLEKASLDEKAAKKGKEEEDYAPAQKKLCNDILEEVKAIRFQMFDPRPDRETINNLHYQMGEIRFENAQLREENAKLKRQLAEINHIEIPIKHTIVGGWRQISSKNLKYFLQKMRMNNCDDMEITLFEKGEPQFFFEGDVLSTYTRYNGQTYEAYTSTLGEVHRLFGYTRETFIDDNIIYRLDINAYKNEEMIKEKRWIEHDRLFISIERFGETCTRVFKRVGDTAAARAVREAIIGKWKLVESDDDDPANINKRIDWYTWEGNTFTRTTTVAGHADLIFSKTLGIPRVNNLAENLTYIEGDRIITTFKRIDTQVEHFRTERYVIDDKLYVVHYNRKNETKTVSIYERQ